MATAGQGVLAGPENADILSQALLQTGVPSSIKMEEEGFGFDLPSDNLLSCDVQTLTNNLISTLDDRPAQENVLSTPTLGPGTLESRFDGSIEGNKPVQHHATVTPTSNISFVDGYSNSGTVKMENGFVPPMQQANSVGHQPAMYAAGNSTGFGTGTDIDLEDLLAIDVGSLDAGTYEAPSNSVAQNYPSSSTVTQQAAYPTVQYNSYQSHSSDQGLPELVDEDLYDILGEDDDQSSFLDGLMEPSEPIPCIQNESNAAAFPAGHQRQQQVGFKTQMPYTSVPPNVTRPFMSGPHADTTTLPPAYGANNSSRQFQQPVAINRPFMLQRQQQMYQKLQGHGRAPTTHNRFPGGPRVFQIPGTSKAAPAALPESQVCVGH
jgi:hypothetical protein